MKEKSDTHQCSSCKAIYKDKEIAKECEKWCKKNCKPKEELKKFRIDDCIVVK